MTGFGEFREAIIRMVQAMIKPAHRRGKAINIDLNKCTCDVDLGNDIVLYSVKLKATEAKNDSGIVIVPKDGSYVTAAMVEGVEADWQLVGYTEIDSAAFFFKNGGKFELKDDGTMWLNGDNFGSLLKIQETVNRINVLEDDLNTIKGVFAGWTPTPNDGGAALKAAASTWAGQQITKTTVSDLENNKVKHGG